MCGIVALEGGSVWVTWSAFGDGYQSGRKARLLTLMVSKFEPLLLNYNNTMGYQMSGPSAYLPNVQIGFQVGTGKSGTRG
ncbi:MAG: hypothetical protein CM15mP106_1200 [Candidatus Neomarinimicrobiota bacterium]|nr:MAG: hypothetical protein CM15mP106_1200 [Candidatus Neomarinimicrobiota bacterium]